MTQCVRKWGFNSIGAFSPTPKATFQYVAHLPTNEYEGVPRIPGAHEVWDPFDVATAAKIAENIAREVRARTKDPLLIGWFIVNESRYDELPRLIPSLDGKHACKREFVAALKNKYSTVEAFNASWQAKAASFDELVDSGLAVTTDAAKMDVKVIIGSFLETYFTQIERLYRQHGENHLLIGSRLQPITIEDEKLCRIMGNHVDVLSCNYYNFGVDTAALGFVIGIEWVTLVDQATPGRWFRQYNGES